MDRRSGFQPKANSMMGNGVGGDATGAAMADIPTRLLESFLPGYSIVSALILDTFGFDISKLVSALFVLLTFFTAARYVWRGLWGTIKPWCSSTVTVGSEDIIFDHLMFWIGKHEVSQNSRTLIASSKRKNWEADDPTDLFQDVGNAAANYTPGFGTPHRFWYKNNYYTFKRESKEIAQMQAQRRRPSQNVYSEQERIHLSCLGRSTTPLKTLIHDAKTAYLQKKSSTTTVRVPNGMFNSWTSVSTRPSRQLTTLSLSPSQSSILLKDISEYLAPESARWYANHGIPYRRGYLFHGPPGTGKTSFSLVLAGMFGLEIHVLSLLDLGLTESKLQHLFLGMPARCIVLLEDVDSAGFTRKKDTSTEISTSEERGTGKSKRFRVTGGDSGNDSEPMTAISLSCLLNVIDGVASHEGRILIMTTNHPERIDPRLIRAGRVDLKVLFDYASREQMVDLFVKMFDKNPGVTSRSDKEMILHGTEKTRDNPEYAGLLDMGKKFAEKLPENELTPAEIQGFLIMRRTSAERALEEVEEWLRELREEKLEKEELAAQAKAEKERERAEKEKEKAEKEALGEKTESEEKEKVEKQGIEKKVKFQGEEKTEKEKPNGVTNEKIADGS